MSLKLKALLILAGFISIVTASAALVSYIAHNVSAEIIQTVFSVGLIGGLLYTVYSLILIRLEHDKKIDEISKNIKEITSK
jgi:hypothetical protein